MLTQTSEELLQALRDALEAWHGGPISVEAMHTGGGCMVARIDLSQDGTNQSRDVWLTREGEGFDGVDAWLMGVYNFALDVEDEGIGVSLWTPREKANDPHWIASQVVGILSRLGVTLYDGEGS